MDLESDGRKGLGHKFPMCTTIQKSLDSLFPKHKKNSFICAILQFLQKCTFKIDFSINGARKNETWVCVKSFISWTYAQRSVNFSICMFRGPKQTCRIHQKRVRCIYSRRNLKCISPLPSSPTFVILHFALGISFRTYVRICTATFSNFSPSEHYCANVCWRKDRKSSRLQSEKKTNIKCSKNVHYLSFATILEALVFA